MLDLFASQVFLRVFGELSIAITDDLLFNYHSVPLSLNFSENVDFFLIVLGSRHCQLYELSFQLLFEVILCSFPHLPGVYVSESDQLQFGKIESDVL